MEYSISTDKTKLDIVIIHDFLGNKSYWAKGRNLEDVKKSIENSICFGVYDRQNHTIGFARVVTDRVVFAYLMDVFILEKHRGKGLGKLLVQHVMQHPDIQVKVWMLGTADAQGLYNKFGFKALDTRDRYMILREELCQSHTQ